MEKWEKWEPINGLPSTLHNDSFVDNREGIRLIFSDENDNMKISVNFEEGVLSYRNTDEGSLIEKLDYLDQQYGTDFYSQWTLFKVNDSEYINWFIEESAGIYDASTIQHYVFLTPNDVIEILTTYPPCIIKTSTQ